MRRLFITGNPTAGKSTLRKMIVERTGARAFSVDRVRAEIADDPRYRPFVNFYLDQDERTYIDSTTPDERWVHLIAQSDGLWPPTKERIDGETRADAAPIVFEGVSLMPHLVARDFPGEPICVVVSSSLDDVLVRLAEQPRWGDTPELQALEAEHFFNVEAPRYRALAEAHGWPVFTSADEALPWCLEKLV